MSQENVEVVRSMLEAFNRDDSAAVVEAFVDDCELHEPPEMPDRPAFGFRGHDGIREWIEKLRIADVRFDARRYTISGDVIVSEWAARAVDGPAACRSNGPPSPCCACATAGSPKRRGS